jgi:glutathione S-transferase
MQGCPFFAKVLPMKLFYSPGACSLSPHIALREAGLSFELAMASTKTKQLADGSDYLAINPKGQVPALLLDSGELLTEGAVIVQYIADQVPQAQLLPAFGTMARYRALEWLNYITTELHKSFGPLFNPAFPAEAKELNKAALLKRLAWIDSQLAGKSYLTGEQFTVADGYLFVVTNWSKFVGMDIADLAHLGAFMARVAARPAVQEALKAEGLLK